MYSLVSLFSGIYPLPAMHSLLVTLYPCDDTTELMMMRNKVTRSSLTGVFHLKYQNVAFIFSALKNVVHTRSISKRTLL